MAGGKRSGYLPSLDGWRALAILAVMMDHDEKPMIRMGHRLAPPATPGHRDLRVEVPAKIVADAGETG